MSNKKDRENKEMMNLFADPKYAREAWKSVGNAILHNPAIKPIERFDNNGDKTYQSLVEEYTYNKLAENLHSIQNEKDREPTELEMIFACQAAKARWDTTAATFVRDTVGGKPIDESKVSADITNPYEKLTDEELELLDKYRKESKGQLTDEEKSHIINSEKVRLN